MERQVKFEYTTITTGASTTNHVPFSAEEVLVVFRHSPDGSGAAHPIPSQLLMFYYVLLYQDCYLTNLKTLCKCVG